MRDKQGYREQIERLAEIYPNKITLTINEAATALGVDRRTMTLLIEKKRIPATNVSTGGKNKHYIIPITAIARFAAG